MKNIVLLISIVMFVSACTKEVPETGKKLTKEIGEKEINEIFDQFTSNFNDGRLDSAFSFYSQDFTAYGPHFDSTVNLEKFTDDIKSYRMQNADKKLIIKIEDISLSEELAAVQSLDSFYAFDPVENKMVPVFSEKSIWLLKKNKSGNWKIFKVLSAQIESY